MRFLFSCSILGKEAAKLRKLKRYKPTKFMAEGSRYDKEAADAAVTFINCLKHTKGEWYGMPFELIDWQEQIVRDIFGILKPNGYRQFNTAYIEIPKKQGKSELAAAIALYLTCGDFEHGGEVYGCASDRQQASIVFDVAVDMVEQCPALKSRIKPMLSQKRLVYKPLGSFYQVLSAEAYTKHGLNVHGVVFDELHAQPNRDLYDVMLHGSGDARKQPLFFLITTAGTDRNSICWEVHQKAEDILQGRKIDPTFYPVIYSAADTDDWTSEKVWRKVNPSLGITVDIEKLRVACENAKQNPAEENLFRQLRLNQWVKQSVRWMPMDKWDKCAFPVDAEKLRGRTCYGGLDLSSTTDITAFVLVFPPLDESDKYQILPFFWIPEENIDQRVRRDHVPYDVWERQGFLYTTEGNVVHYGFIETFIEELGMKYNIKEIAFDRWGAIQMTQNLEALGFTVVPFGQGFKDMSPPTKELMKLTLEERIAHGGNPVLRWMMDNIYVKTDPAGNIKPDKEKSTERIDGAVALIMALDRALRHDGDERNGSIYDERGLLNMSVFSRLFKARESISVFSRSKNKPVR
jgi:phage terminase large subunit-like protein